MDPTVVSTVALFITALFAFLTKRDSLRHDADVRSLKSQNEGQAIQMSSQAKEIEILKADNSKCEDRVHKLEEEMRRTLIQTMQSMRSAVHDVKDTAQVAIAKAAIAEKKADKEN